MKPLLLSIFIFLSFSNAYAFDYNQKILTKKRLKNSLSNFSMTTDIDYRRRENKLNYRHYDAGLRRYFKDDWSISLKYRHVYKKKKNEWDLSEIRPQFQITKSSNSDSLKLISRFRQEYRIRDGDDVMRSRFRLRLKSKKKILGVKPFISNEFFYDPEISRYNKNISDVGISLPKISILSPSISYRYTRSYDEIIRKWEDDSLILFKMKINW